MGPRVLINGIWYKPHRLPEITMARVNLSGMSVEALMDLRKRVDQMLLSVVPRLKLAWFLRRRPGRGGPCRHGTQYVVEGVSEFDRGRGRKCKPCRDMNDGLLPLLGCIVDSFREKTRRSYGDDDCTAIERGADDLIPVNLQDTAIVLNPEFLLDVCHGYVLGFCCF